MYTDVMQNSRTFQIEAIGSSQSVEILQIIKYLEGDAGYMLGMFGFILAVFCQFMDELKLIISLVV
jgi:hypothetical protein